MLFSFSGKFFLFWMFLLQNDKNTDNIFFFFFKFSLTYLCKCVLGFPSGNCVKSNCAKYPRSHATTIQALNKILALYMYICCFTLIEFSFEFIFFCSALTWSPICSWTVSEERGDVLYASTWQTTTRIVLGSQINVIRCSSWLRVLYVSVCPQ